MIVSNHIETEITWNIYLNIRQAALSYSLHLHAKKQIHTFMIMCD